MNLKKINLSIAIPVFNGGKNLDTILKRFITECNKKKFKDYFELVISDNASTDNTKNIVQKYKKVLSKNNFIRIKYFRQRKNLGYPKNLIKVIKLCSSKYLMTLSDDNIPGNGFYKEIFDYLNKFNLTELGFVPISATGILKNKFYKNKLGYVLTRGSVLSGTLLKTKNISFKFVSNNLYVHNIIFINYFLKHGLKQINLKSKINMLNSQKISEKFNDRVGRKSDFAVIDKIKTVEIFYKKNKISYFNFLISIFKIYTWCIDIKYNLKQEREYNLEKKFFNEILKYKNKKIILICFIIILLRNTFTKRFSFILSSLWLNLFFKSNN